MNEDHKQWVEVELPPLTATTILKEPEPILTGIASIDINTVKYIIRDKDGNRRIKFYDNEVLYVDSTYALDLLPR